MHYLGFPKIVCSAQTNPNFIFNHNATACNANLQFFRISMFQLCSIPHYKCKIRASSIKKSQKIKHHGLYFCKVLERPYAGMHPD